MKIDGSKYLSGCGNSLMCEKEVVEFQFEDAHLHLCIRYYNIIHM